MFGNLLSDSVVVQFGLFRVYFDKEDRDLFSNYDETEGFSIDPQAYTFANRYKLGSKIARGAFATVYKATDSSGKLYAVKIYLRKYCYLAEREARILDVLKQFEVPNILFPEECVKIEDRCCLIFDFQPQNLLDSIKDNLPFSDENFAKCTKKLICTLADTHSKGILHSDLKPENILVGPEGVYLTDWNLAILADKQSKTLVGTLGYQAPEVLKKKQVDFPGDVWALGLVLFELRCGISGNQAKKRSLRQFLRVEYKEQEFPIETLLQRMLNFDPEKRWSSKDCKNYVLRVFPRDGRCRIKHSGRITRSSRKFKRKGYKSATTSGEVEM